MASTNDEITAFCLANMHYLESIVCLSDTMTVLASSDILDEHGNKLWAKGVPISRSFQEKIMRRRLQKPMESSLEVEQGTSMENIIDDCFALMKQTPALAALGAASEAKASLRALRDTPLPEPLKLLLTSLKAHKNNSYTHSLATMIIGSGLAHGVGLNEDDAGALIISALLCDIGEIYLNPEYLDDRRQLRPAEWKHVLTHPCVGQAFLDEFTDFPNVVSNCVLHHHERPNGSGYPFQLSGPGISPLCKLLGVADTVAAIVLRSDAAIYERVAVALRIIPDEFPRPAVSFINHALARLDTVSTPAVSGSFAERVLPVLQQLRSARLLAKAMSKTGSIPCVANIGCLALDVLHNIDKCLRATDVYEFSHLDVLEHDSLCMGELCLILDEVSWRLRQLARNIYWRAEMSEEASDLLQIADLVAVLNAPNLTPSPTAH